MIVENEFPILEYSTEKNAVIDPVCRGGQEKGPFPRLCLMTFFQEVLDAFVEQYHGEMIGTYISEMRKFHLYKLQYKEVEICVIQAVVGSASIAMMTDWLFGAGVEVLLCCGGCGVLADIPAGDIILPVRALRDEGASYKYLPPSRYIDLNEVPVQVFKRVLAKHQLPYIKCTTWSTDGFYRETKEMVEHRIKQGCQAVEMECSAMAAIAQYRGKVFGQLLYSGDILVGNEEYDDRCWNENLSARERIFRVTLEALLEFVEN